ncbi:MAG: 2OG-Fe(II) oxygenase [Verrucomicrobiota bacterium]
MANDGISVPYNRDLKALEELLSGVRRPGDFFVQGSLETPMPRVEVEGVGVISFPVPETQLQQLIEQATRAPYGQGEDTLHNETVRKTWQLPASTVRIGGKSWEKTFSQLLASVVDGLGCGEAMVSAELYKLLVYDPGGFFAAHRDTEKAGGMFGTLVVVLPSAHRGGELVIRHAGREVTIDLSSEEFSELKFAAFYADCEHEVRPVAEGHRVCLIYNLIQLSGAKTEESLRAPLYSDEIAAATEMLKDAFAAPAPAKLAWLLEHQYSPDGLSFAGLKGEDAAFAKVLRAAAESAGCAVHLGIVHIEEYGPAQPHYELDYGYGRHRGWRRYDYDEVEEDASSDSFEVIEVSDSSRHIDQWVDTQDQPVAFGKLPLEDGEVLPAGALDDEAPDEQRLMEATGNEGASFERSYHRAALVIWPKERFAGVLLQAGVSAALPHLAERLDARDKGAAGIAEQIVESWEQPPTVWSYLGQPKEPSRAAMLRLLTKLGDRALLKRFISGVVTREFDGSENDALADALQTVGPKDAGTLLATIARENMPLFHGDCVRLFDRVLSELGEKLDTYWRAALRDAAAAIVLALPAIKPKPDPYASGRWQRLQKAKPVDAGMVAGLLDCVRTIGADDLRMDAAVSFIAERSVFDPGNVIVPALTLLREREREQSGFVSDAAVGRLWVHAAEFLLARSEQPPASPTDWRLEVKLSCQCKDCRALQSFALDAQAQVARFKSAEHRRMHLERQIREHGLDMSCLTERKGSPRTLVCTKTRRTFHRQCEQHRNDCASMAVLLDVMRPPPDALAKLAQRLLVAKELKPEKCE